MSTNTGNRSVDFLNKVYQNAKMGSDSINYLTDKITDAALLSDLQTQHSSYSSIINKTQTELANNQALPKETSPASQVGLWSGVQLNTLVDKSPCHIAEMLIQGSTMGVIDMTKTLKEYSDAPQNLKDIGQELIQLEENSIQKMKQYL